MIPYILIPIIAFTLTSCSNFRNQEAINNDKGFAIVATVDTSEDFDDFNKQFHSDSVFQMSRIVFPIAGFYADGEGKHQWTAKNWTLMKEPVREITDTTEYKHSLYKTNSSVTEKYWIENSGFRIERRFEKKSGKWFLTFYEDTEI
jgi:hypothetical protein